MNRDHPAYPAVFQDLMDLGCIYPQDLHATDDGFVMTDRSVADILLGKNISALSAPGSEPLPCQYFYDDWYLYCVPPENIWGLLKMREQEADAANQIKADGDTPGVTIAFIAFDPHLLTACLEDPGLENQSALRKELHRVTAAKGQTHHEALKAYFISPKSQAPYLIAKRFCQKIAKTARDGKIPVPLRYAEIVNRSRSFGFSLGAKRLPRFIAANNTEAGYPVCDQQVIYIRDPEHLSPHEQLAILATHTGNVSFHSFAAEVVYHARFLVGLAKISIPLVGWSVYSSAIRADMSIAASSLEAFAPFYSLNSPLVRQQMNHHSQE